MKRRERDRRGAPRFEIMGDLWGTFETVLRVQVHDVGAAGALIESHVPLALDSIHRIACDGPLGEVSAQVRVRHVRRTVQSEAAESYLVGVEFLTQSAPVAERLRKSRRDSPELPGSVV